MLGQLAQTMMQSPLKQSLKLRPSGGQQKKSPVATMMLTSLVDAFTIVVIYLLVNSTTAEQMELQDGIKLPQASQSKQFDQSPIVVFKDEQFQIKGQAVSEEELRNFLKEVKENSQGIITDDEAAIVVQADENTDFQKLQPLIVASSYAGIQKVKFAVLHKENQK